MQKLFLPAGDTTWMDGAMRPTGRENAVYFQLVNTSDSGWNVSDYYRSGVLLMTGMYTDQPLTLRQGVFRWYDTEGHIELLRTFDYAKANGPEIRYWKNGHEKIKGNNTDGQRDGTWTAYFESGKLAGNATYQGGQQTELKLYHEDGSANVTDTVFYRPAQFPGGAAAWLHFINKNMKFPKGAISRHVDGSVVIAFDVQKDGKLVDMKPLQPGDKDLDDEAMRVMGLVPSWEPEVVAGVPYDSHAHQTLTWRLEN